MPTQTHALARSTGRDAATGLVSLIALAVVVVAIPMALITFIGWPLPHEMPSFGDVTDALGDRYVPDRFVVGALACVCWLIWVELVASVVVETFAYVRGEKSADVPLAGGMQKVVGRLIGGAALLVAAFLARGETPDAIKPLVPAQPTPIAELAGIDIDLTVDPVAGQAGSMVETLPTYTVEPRDTLWAIAEQTLGDPFRWGEIWELNAQRDMGGRTFVDPDLIIPGWRLQLPADALVPGAELTTSTGLSEDAPASDKSSEKTGDADGGSGERSQGSGGDGLAGGGLAGGAGGGDSSGGMGSGYFGSTEDGPTRVEVLQPLDEAEPDGPNGGVIAGPRVETLDPLPTSGELAEDDPSVHGATGASATTD